MEIITRTKYIQLFLIITLILTCVSSYAKTEWLPLKVGLKYAVILPNPKDHSQRLHAYQFDLKYYQMQIVSAKSFKQSSAYVKKFATENKALIAVNGGFFTPDLKPLGLRVSSGEILNNIKKTSWWGIFYIKNNKARISSSRQFNFQRGISFAIQAGPRLLVNGVIPKLKANKLAERSALCINNQGKVNIIITENFPVTSKQLATKIKTDEKHNGLNCVNALNLDGGSSSQLYANVGYFQSYVKSIRPIVDAIIVTKKN